MYPSLPERTSVRIWFVDSATNPQWSVQYCTSDSATLLDSSTLTFNPHGGTKMLLIRLAPGLGSVPANTSWFGKVRSKAMIPVSPGDVIKVSGWFTWAADQSVVLPSGAAGFCIGQRVSVLVLDASGNVLGDGDAVPVAPPPAGGPFPASTSINDFINLINYTPTLVSYCIQIPASFGGGVPAYIQGLCEGYVINPTGSAVSLPSGKVADLLFDDLSITIQAGLHDAGGVNTAYTPLRVSPHPLTSPVPTTATTGVINIASSSMSFADGVVDYHSGSISGLNAGQTYDVYCNDPAFLGRGVTYLVAGFLSDLTASIGHIYFGRITIPNVGAASGNTGTRGGSGSWVN